MTGTDTQKYVELLPKNASVCAQWVRCGRVPCRCAAGGRHGPYWYLFWREDGRLRKRYVRNAEAEPLQKALAERRGSRHRLAGQIARGQEALRQSRARVRDMESIWRG